MFNGFISDGRTLVTVSIARKHWIRHRNDQVRPAVPRLYQPYIISFAWMEGARRCQILKAPQI